MAASHPPVTTTTNSWLLQIIMAMSSLAMASALGIYLHPWLLLFTTHIIEDSPACWRALRHHWLTPPLLLIALLAALLFYTDILAQPVPQPQSNPQHRVAPSSGDNDDDDDDDDDDDLTEPSDMDTDLDHGQFENSIDAAGIKEVEEVSAENTIAPSLGAASATGIRLHRRLTRSKSERGPPAITTSEAGSSRVRQFSGNRRVKMVIVADLPTKEEEEGQGREGDHDADHLNQRAADFISGYYQKAQQQR